MKSKVYRKAQKIELFIMDVDGVLTDGKIYLGNNGEELKAFHAQDGQGIKLGQKEGIRFAIITGRKSKIVDNRAQELDIKDVFQGIDNKYRVYKNLLKKYNLSSEKIAYIGDDISDIPILKEVGLSLTVADGVESVKRLVDYVADNKGGRGAVREVMNIILEAKEVFPVYE